ncbi:MAG: protein phosphatase 2C domain-containing protein [Anaerolineales bacterium]|nr:protein phosphatase 2C domain-containing protein [Anaerolineales bacterium]
MLEIGQASDIGVQRKEKGNQDCIGVSLPDKTTSMPALMVIADGMGGYTGGSLASSLVIETILEQYRTTNAPAGTNLCEILRQGILAAHEKLLFKAKDDPELAKMGSTVVAVVVQGNQVCLANVGDSRAYVINEDEIKQISWDHSLVGEMVRAGMLTTIEARTHSKRNILTNSISAHREKFDIYTTSYELSLDDIIVLCSDGLWGPVSESQIQAVVVELPPQRAADKLVELANRNQGPDNISVIVAKQVAEAAPEEAESTDVDLEDTQP